MAAARPEPVNEKNALFLSVDWGTTRLRVRFVRREPFAVLAESSSGEGVAPIHAQWGSRHPQPPRVEFFAERLAAAIRVCVREQPLPLSSLPVVASGMASSTIGMLELPYAPAPIKLSGEDLLGKTCEQLDDFPAGLLLVSGVASEGDVMRGEETELIGLAAQGFGDGLYLLPGTHSKHLVVRDDRLVASRTFLTGELYDLLARRSVLASAVDADGVVAPGAAFRAAVHDAARTGGLIGGLFSVRAAALLHNASGRDGAERLSGLLIGAELAGLSERAFAGQIVLCVNERLRPLYTAALEELGLGASVEVVGPQQHREAVPRAHARLLELRDA